MKTLSCLALAVTATLLVACGGGSDSDSTPSGPVQNPPATGGGTPPAVTPPANTAVNITGVFAGAGTVFGASQEVVVAYQSGTVFIFTGTAGTNVQAANIYGRAGISNAGGVTSNNASAPLNRFFLPNGSTAFAPYSGSYTTSNGTVTSVNGMVNTGTSVTLNASSLNRSGQYVQASLTRLPPGTYRARVSTTGEMATMVVTTGGSFSLNTPGNCVINGTSAAPTLTGAPGVSVNMDASGQCFPGSTTGAALFGPGLVGTANARLLIGGNDTRGVTGLALSAELVSADSTPQAPAFPSKAVGLFETENGQRMMLIDESDNAILMATESSNPALYTSIAMGRLRNGGSPIPPGGTSTFFRDQLSGSLTAFSRGSKYTSQATGQFLAPRSSPTSIFTELAVPNTADQTKSFGNSNMFTPSANGRAFIYDRMARVSEVVGRYSVRDFAGGPIHNFTIASNGALTGTLGTCQMTGQLTARNKNIFDVTVTFGNASQGCSNTRVANQAVLGSTYRGISYAYNSNGQAFSFFALFDSANSVGYGVRVTRCGPDSDLCQ